MQCIIKRIFESASNKLPLSGTLSTRDVGRDVTSLQHEAHESSQGANPTIAFSTTRQWGGRLHSHRGMLAKSPGGSFPTNLSLSGVSLPVRWGW